MTVVTITLNVSDGDTYVRDYVDVNLGKAVADIHALADRPQSFSVSIETRERSYPDDYCRATAGGNGACILTPDHRGTEHRDANGHTFTDACGDCGINTPTLARMVRHMAEIHNR